MLYVSEYLNIPILCTRKHKQILLDYARRNAINIPTPICVDDLKDKGSTYNIDKVLIDEIEIVIDELLQGYRRNLCCIAGTISSDDKKDILRNFDENGYKDIPIEDFIQGVR